MEGKRISQLTPDISPSTDDYIVTVDGSTTQNKRVELGDLPVSNPTKSYVDNVTPIYGTGFPNGVVSATPGRIYIDENITNGASSWIKKSGTGNTGWQVLEGDTGWRNITSLLINGWTAVQVRVRRCDSVVIYGFEALNATTSTAIALMNTPPGFRPTGLGVVNDRQFLTTATNPAVVWRAVLNVTDFTVQGASTSLALLYGTVNSSTTEAWPSTLPGTAV